MESTDHVVDVNGVEARIWNGVTESGAQCFVFVHRIAVHPAEDAASFERELREMDAPKSVKEGDAVSETTLFDYRASEKLYTDDVPFHALVMAAMRKADSFNALRLRAAFPRVWDELDQRYNAPGGWLDGERPAGEVAP